MITEEEPEREDHFPDDAAADLELQEILDEEIHQVIFADALDDAVMNLALEDRLYDDKDRFGFDPILDNLEPNGDADAVNENEGPEDNGGWTHTYPLRPGAEDCSYYMKTGKCKFGANCKFNHSPRRNTQTIRERLKTRREDFEQPGQTECKYYLTSGGCKYGKACKYNHSRERSKVAPVLEFNFLGLPIRLGEKECPYYMRTGSCKYGSSCKFNHPDPTSVAAPDPVRSYVNGGSVHFQSSTSAKSNPSWSAVPVLLPANQTIPLQNPDWNSYHQTQVYPASERSLPTPPAFAINNIATETNFFARHQHQMPVDEYPERPGQPECTYFLKTGECKFKSSCRFHHPKTGLSKTTCAISDKGLPLRPDRSICSFYSRYGICKFGPACKFDHPENWGNSESSDGARMVRKEEEANLC